MIMEARAIIERLDKLGIEATVKGVYIELAPWSVLPEYLLAELKAHKPEVMALLKQKGYRIRYPDAQATRQELDEIVERVHSEGYVLLWSNVLQDLVAFYRDEDVKSKIPPGFVPYSKAELEQLFGDTKPSISTMRLIHEAKKRGGNVVNNGTKDTA